jgi:hypothetical protein
MTVAISWCIWNVLEKTSLAEEAAHITPYSPVKAYLHSFSLNIKYIDSFYLAYQICL